jgi:hypothetical protein
MHSGESTSHQPKENYMFNHLLTITIEIQIITIVLMDIIAMIKMVPTYRTWGMSWSFIITSCVVALVPQLLIYCAAGYVSLFMLAAVLNIAIMVRIATAVMWRELWIKA